MTAGYHTTAEWKRLVRVYKPRLAAEIEQGLGQCVNCGGAIPPGTPASHWQVGHRVDYALSQDSSYENVGPSHSKASGRACNQISGGRLGAAIQQTNNKRDRRLPNW